MGGSRAAKMVALAADKVCVWTLVISWLRGAWVLSQARPAAAVNTAINRTAWTKRAFKRQLLKWFTVTVETPDCQIECAAREQREIGQIR